MPPVHPSYRRYSPAFERCQCKPKTAHFCQLKISHLGDCWRECGGPGCWRSLTVAKSLAGRVGSTSLPSLALHLAQLRVFQAIDAIHFCQTAFPVHPDLRGVQSGAAAHHGSRHVTTLPVGSYACATVSGMERLTQQHYPNSSRVLFSSNRSPRHSPRLQSVGFPRPAKSPSRTARAVRSLVAYSPLTCQEEATQTVFAQTEVTLAGRAE